MPKNPVRAARQASRQAIRTAKTAKRQDARAINTAKKVEKIATKTASKVAKIQGSAPKRAADVPMEKIEAKGIGKIAMPKASTGIGPVKTTPRSMTEVAKGMKPKPKKETPRAKTAPKDTGKKAAEGAKNLGKRVVETVKKSTSGGKKGLADGSLSKNVLDYSAREIAEGISNTAKTAKDAAYNKAKGVVDDVYNTAKRKAGYVGDAFDAGYNFLFKEKGGAVKKKYQTGGMTPMKKVTPAMKSKNVGTKSTSSSSTRPNMSKYKINPAAGGMKRGGTVKKYQAGGMTGGSKLAGTGNLAKAKAKSAVKLNSPSTINKMQMPTARKVATPGRINPMTGGMKKGGMVKRKK